MDNIHQNPEPMSDPIVIPRELLVEAFVKVLTDRHFSESQIKDVETALAGPAVLLMPTTGGECLMMKQLDSHGLGPNPSILEDPSDESTCEELPENATPAESSRIASHDLDHPPGKLPGVSIGKPKSITTLSFTPDHNYLGSLNLMSWPPHAVKFFFRVKLDTGSDFNLLTVARLKCLEIDSDFVKLCRQEISTLAGAVVATKRVKLSFVMDGWPYKYTAWFYVLECMCNNDAILGHKFINKFRVWPSGGILNEILAAQSAVTEGRQSE